MTQPPSDGPWAAPPTDGHDAPGSGQPYAFDRPWTVAEPPATYDPIPSYAFPTGQALVASTAALSTLPQHPVEYHQMLRTPRRRWWKGLLMIASFVVAYLVLSLVLQGAALGIDVATGRVPAGDLLQGRLTLTPTLLLSVNLTNAACIPLSMLLQRAFFGQRRRWLHSVTGRFRWRMLGQAALFVVPVWALYLTVTALLDPQPLVAPRGEAVVLLVIVLLTTPLQSAGEEYGARGLIARGAGSWLGGRRAALVVSTVVSSVVFMLAHGAGDPWLIGFYFGFGVVVSLVTWRTGGLEVAVLMHATNNLVAFGSGILTGQDLSQALDRSNGTGGPGVLLPLGALLLSLGGVWLWTRRTRPVRAFEPVADERAAPPKGGWTYGPYPAKT